MTTAKSKSKWTTISRFAQRRAFQIEPVPQRCGAGFFFAGESSGRFTVERIRYDHFETARELINATPLDPRLEERQSKRTNMKKTLLSLACALAATTAFAADEVVSTTTTTTSTGTIHEYTPGSTFIVKESTGPVTYSYGDKVTYVTKTGKVLTDADVKARIKVGAPVSVHYRKDGDKRVVTKVEIDD